jgi:hypothetical protein
LPDTTVVLKDSTCFELRLGSGYQFASICKSLDILVVADARQHAATAHQLRLHHQPQPQSPLLALHLHAHAVPVLPGRRRASVDARLQRDRQARPDRLRELVRRLGLRARLPADSHQLPAGGRRQPLAPADRLREDIASTEQFADCDRKALKSAILSDAIADWVPTQFGLSKERAFRRPVLQQFGTLRPQECLRGEVDRAGVVGNFQNLVFAFSGCSQIALLLANWKQCITLTAMSDFACESSERPALSCGEAFFIGYDPQTMTVVKSSPDQRTAAHNYAVFLTGVTVFRKSVIDVVDYHDVFVCRAYTAYLARRRRSRASSQTPASAF